MDDTVLTLGRTFDKAPSRRLGRRPRVGALLAAGLIASGVMQLPASAVAAPAFRTQTPSAAEGGLRSPAANPTPERRIKVIRPRLFVDGDTVFEGEDAVFELSLSKFTHRRVTVRFFTEDGSARGGSDYEEVSGSRSFRPGSRHAFVSVETFRDRKREGNESFFLRVFDVRGATRGDTFGRATILDRNRNNPQPCHPRCKPPCQPHCPPPCAHVLHHRAPICPAAVPAELPAAAVPAELPAAAVPAELPTTTTTSASASASAAASAASASSSSSSSAASAAASSAAASAGATRPAAGATRTHHQDLRTHHQDLRTHHQDRRTHHQDRLQLHCGDGSTAHCSEATFTSGVRHRYRSTVMLGPGAGRVGAPDGAEGIGSRQSPL